MGKEKSLKKNAVVGVCNTIINIVFPLIIYMYTSRVLEPVGVGITQLATSVSSYFELFASLGIPLYAVREISRLREDSQEQYKNAIEIFWTNLINATVMLSLYVVFISLLYGFTLTFYIYLIYGLTIFSTAIGVEWFYKANEEFAYITIRNLIVKILSFVLIVIFINDKSDLLLYALISIGSILGYSVINFIKFAKTVKLRLIKFKYLKHLKPALAVFLMTIATTIYCSLDSVMLGFIKDEYSVGIYSSAYKVTVSVIAVTTAINSIMLPRLSYYYKNNETEKIKNVLTTCYQITLMIAIPAVLGIEIFAENVVWLFSGEKFLEAATALRIISPIILFVSLTNIIGIQVFYSSGNIKKTVISVTIGALVNVVLNSILIPILSFNGAALGTLFAEFTVLVVQLMIGRELLIFKKIDKNICKIILSTIVMTCVLILIKSFIEVNYLLDMIIFVPIGMAIYFMFLLIFREKYIDLGLKFIIRKLKRRK